jgi:predicted transglutaminase-like protease
MNTNIHLTELGHAKATLCKPMSNFCKHHKQIRIREKVFSLKKIILLKYSAVRSYFEAFIETNTTVQSDFDFDARC